MGGEGLFTFALASALLILFFFILLLFASLFAQTEPGELLQAVTSPEVRSSLRLSLLTASMSTSFCLILAIPSAYAISRFTFPGKGLLDALLDLPLVLPPIALGVALLSFFGTPVGRAIERHMIPFVFERPGIVLAQFAVVLAFSVRLLKATFDALGRRYEDVARTLGCSAFSGFFQITLPMAKEGLLATFILSWTRALGEFGATITLVGATPGKTDVASIAIFLNLASARIERAVAIVAILILIALAALLTLRKLLRRPTLP